MFILCFVECLESPIYGLYSCSISLKEENFVRDMWNKAIKLDLLVHKEPMAHIVPLYACRIRFLSIVSIVHIIRLISTPTKETDRKWASLLKKDNAVYLFMHGPLPSPNPEKQPSKTPSTLFSNPPMLMSPQSMFYFISLRPNCASIPTSLWKNEITKRRKFTKR